MEAGPVGVSDQRLQAGGGVEVGWGVSQQGT